MHVEEKNQKRLRDDLELVKQTLISDQFRAFLLPALPRVDHSELVEFLTEPDNTTCPPSLATQIASLMYRDTDGIYDKTVKHIETAERSGWGSLLTELSRRHGPVSYTHLDVYKRQVQQICRSRRRANIDGESRDVPVPRQVVGNLGLAGARFSRQQQRRAQMQCGIDR